MGMTERPIVLQGTGVRKYFPVHTGFGKPKKYVKAVDGVDITIHEGEIYGLVGETGCGKSTLGRTLIRLTDPTDGNISVLGKDITKLNDKQMTDMRQKIQMVFQDPYTSLDPKQKVGDILMETLEIHGIGSKKDRLDIAMEIIGKGWSAARAFLPLSPRIFRWAETTSRPGQSFDLKSEGDRLR